MLGINLSGAEFGKGDKYGWDYIYPSAKDLQFYSDKGITLVRLPVRWERLQPTLGGELDKAELGRLLKFLDNAKAAGVEVIVDVHNYGRYDGKAIGTAQVPVEKFADFWSKLAGAIGSKDAVYAYDLMNEPHGMPSDMAWPDAAQAATDAIRTLGDKHAIFVEGEHWAGASDWSAQNPNLDIKDPLDNIVYEAHVYFDKNGSGTYLGGYDTEKAYADIGEKKLKSFVSWLQQKGAKGFIGEFAVPSNDPRWQVVLDNFLETMNEYGLSGTYWGAGSWFNGYGPGLLDKAGKPKASLDTLLKHLDASKSVGVGATETAGKAKLTSGGGNDALVGTAGADTLDGGAGADTMTGGEGSDVYRVDHVGDRVIEHVGQGRDRVEASVSWTLNKFVEDLKLTGTAANGTGNGFANVITGNAAANVLMGLGGDDVLDGGAGSDTMVGGMGNDTFHVDASGDKVVEKSREGTDTVVAKLSWTLDENIENLILSGGGAITGVGNGCDNVLTGNAGASTLYGMEGEDRLFGGDGNDVLYGGKHEDRLDGGAGDDVLIGGEGRDWMTGGAGRDRFVFQDKNDSKNSRMDRITDFTRGQDRIDLSGVDANSKSAGDQTFRFIGDAGFSKKAGELRYDLRDGYTVVQGDINGDGAADFVFRVEQVAYKAEVSDFML